MKKGTIFLLLAVIGFVGVAFQTTELCNVKLLKSELKKELNPDYKYDASNVTRFTYSSKFQGKEIEVPLFDGQKYRFAFNINGADKNFQIYISYEKAGDKNRKNIFALKDIRKEGQDIYVFEPKDSKKVYITYIIPPSVESTNSSCVAFILGYQFNSF
ncbi:MAG: hypothetical protein HRT73_11175 [Flavobacteriales bacterium]|nr:hypothetical protein [Flavobacteriales bacterium]NQX98422.1 hypothetical protein [Flavobacteriales bacterium]